MELVVRRVDRGAEVDRRRPLAVPEAADVEVAEPVAPRPERGEDQRMAIPADLWVELPVRLGVGRIEREVGVDLGERLAWGESLPGRPGAVDVPIRIGNGAEGAAPEVERAVRRCRGVELVGVAVDLRAEVDRLAPAVGRALDHPEVHVDLRFSVDRAVRGEVEPTTVGRDERVDVAVRARERRHLGRAPGAVLLQVRHHDRGLAGDGEEPVAHREVGRLSVIGEGDAPLPAAVGDGARREDLGPLGPGGEERGGRLELRRGDGVALVLTRRDGDRGEGQDVDTGRPQGFRHAASWCGCTR